MSILYFPNDILQYIINIYINYYSDFENLESLIKPINFKFKLNLMKKSNMNIMI